LRIALAVGRYLCANGFESEVICQPSVREQLIVILFTSRAFTHCESKLQQSEHHETAAKSHRTAAEHHGKGDHTKGREESSKAQSHSKTAREQSETAHGKSHSTK
jgi:hypothetical protein